MSALLQKISEVTGIAEPYDEAAAKKQDKDAKAPVDSEDATNKVVGLFDVLKDSKKKAGTKAKKEIDLIDISPKKATADSTDVKAPADDDKPILAAIADADDSNDIVRATNQSKEDNKMADRRMQDMDFYGNAGQKMFDFDRGLAMDQSLKLWIIDKFSEDQDLVKEVLKTLPTVIEKNPKLVPEIKQMIKDAAEANIPYTITYLSKVDDKEYESLADAEASVSDLAKRLNLKATEMLRVVYRLVKEDGSLGKKVSREEVEDFVNTFDGDRNALRKKLQLPDPKKANKGNSNKGDKPKNDDAKADADKADDTK